MIKRPVNRWPFALKWRLSVLLSVYCFLNTIQSQAQILTDDHNLAVDLIYEAKTLIENSNYKPAIENLKQSVALDSIIREEYTLLTQACFYQNDMATAKEYLRKAKLIFLEDDELCYYLGKVYEKEMNLQLAINEYGEAIKWSSVNGTDYPIVFDYYASRGTCYLLLGEYQKALTDLDQAFAFNNSKADILIKRGIALYHLNQKEEACRNWEKAYEMGLQQALVYLDQNCK